MTEINGEGTGLIHAPGAKRSPGISPAMSQTNPMKIQIKRVYEPADPSDGYRILVDRLWPRGLTKESAAVDEWLRDAAPSAELRRWFGHEPGRWSEFKRRYLEELHNEPAATALGRLREVVARQRVTLLYGAKDEAHNNAVALLEQLEAPHNE